jgi:prepilin-type N-terminal cleavage/methylation domain-containing protein
MLKRIRQGFTLIELIIVVAILLILGLVAVPAFVKYLRRTKTQEAVDNVRKLFDSSVAYFESEHKSKSGAVLPRQFPASVGRTPAEPCCKTKGKKCIPKKDTFENPTWSALNFSIEDPFYFQYQYDSSGTDAASKFEASAFGDLDCDGIFSTYTRSGTITNENSVSGGAGLVTKNDIE